MALVQVRTARLEPLRAGVRGFTLVELMAVVIIIAVLSALAIPSMINRMRDRRVQQAGDEIASLYRTARLQAMGRGSAVLVRFDSRVVENGVFEVREAVWGPSTPSNAANPAACLRLPSSSCTVNTANAPVSWATVNPATDDNRLLNVFSLESGLYDNVFVSMLAPTGGDTLDFLDVCFTPMGRALFRTTDDGVFAPLTTVHRAEVSRRPSGLPDGDIVGVTRRVALLPNGAARIIQ